MWRALAGAVLSFLGVGGGSVGRAISDIVGDLTDSRVRLAMAKTEEEKARIAADVARLEAELGAQERLIAGKQGGRLVLILPQAIMGYSLAAYVFKVFVWDFVLNLGVTGELKGNTWAIALIVLGGYFITAARR